MCLWMLTFWGWGVICRYGCSPFSFEPLAKWGISYGQNVNFNSIYTACFFFQNWWLSRYIYMLYKHTKVESQAFFPPPLSLDCFFLIKTALKQSYFLSQRDEMNENISEDNTFTPRTGNNLIFSELIWLRRVTHSQVCVWKKHLPRFINQQTFLYLKEWLKTSF